SCQQVDAPARGVAMERHPQAVVLLACHSEPECLDEEGGCRVAVGDGEGHCLQADDGAGALDRGVEPHPRGPEDIVKRYRPRLPSVGGSEVYWRYSRCRRLWSLDQL